MSAAPLELDPALEEGALVLADLHLDVWEREAGERFAAWLEERADAPALLVLGDLFDAWVSPRLVELPGPAAVARACARLAARGARIALVPGNRDFLLDARFARAAGLRLAPAGLVARVGEERVLFLHGDELCTLDRGYQRLRAVLRSAPVRLVAPHVPLAVGRALGRRLRRASTRAVRAKPPEEKRMQADEAARRLAGARAQVLVCGHAHEYRSSALDGGRWIVLDAFGGARDLLRVEGGALVPRSSRG